MKILIFEDEKLAGEGLTNMLADVSATVLGVLPSIEAGRRWFSANQAPDLILSDIRLQDGLSFQLFHELNIQTPIIFITAYDHYAIKAFEVNSVDYLLKPIDKDSLMSAIDKFENRLVVKESAPEQEPPNQFENLMKLIANQKRTYKSRFLIKVGQKIKAVGIEKVAYFYSQHKLTYLVTQDNQKFPIDLTLENLEEQLDPDKFYRANRQFMVSFESIHELHPYFKGRLKVDLNPSVDLELVVSSEKTREFKAWLDK